ncbi:Fe-S cluster biogenesis protein NfuA, 4Fe-4S-binding domain [Cyclobacterium lianum]|uniref:Fe-S cluster biogenesis protein NfuA, 4Fe-4S-binding domain n=1 Tax=Cyclobacterium lianum TaxID=388280 RepID=A0A1M7QSZ0_9BACT|nr:NifU family protein [Cyclobacterium lianum]SHN34925.1 Fe-S cluster biogenesis protein NfuA, 4Fe-4S-binding domain [Cyclobacterium lianum]
MLDQYKEQIEMALDTIRPYLEADGGNVKVIGLTEEMVLQLELTGTCSSCPMSTMTLKAGVEEAIKKAIPEISKVEAVNVEVA